MSLMDLMEPLERWRQEGKKAALATVVGMESSAPLDPGAAMAVSSGQDVAGSVSGGCVEGALFEALMEVMASGEPRIETYGISDEDAFSVGLSCGGTIHVLLEPLDDQAPWFVALKEAAGRKEPLALVAVTGGEGLGRRLVVTEGALAGTTGDAGRDRELSERARSAIAEDTQAQAEVPGEGSVFIEVHGAAPTMYVFGFVAFASALARLGRFLGYHVVVVDPRATFLTEQRFPEADEIINRWPHEVLAERRVWAKDAVCVLSHDPKIDVPAIQTALRTPAGYICAIGGKRTRERRRALLLEAGVGEDALSRLCAPAGLDLGGRTAEETALSIAAELVATRHGRPGGRLVDKKAGIHA